MCVFNKLDMWVLLIEHVGFIDWTSGFYWLNMWVLLIETCGFYWLNMWVLLIEHVGFIDWTCGFYWLNMWVLLIGHVGFRSYKIIHKYWVYLAVHLINIDKYYFEYPHFHPRCWLAGDILSYYGKSFDIVLIYRLIINRYLEILRFLKRCVGVNFIMTLQYLAQTPFTMRGA